MPARRGYYGRGPVRRRRGTRSRPTRRGSSRRRTRSAPRAGPIGFRL